MPWLAPQDPQGGILPGRAYRCDTPLLRAHAGTQPDLYLCWNAIPAGTAALDLVVHLHGFSRAGGAMALSEKVEASGLDLAGRTRPTLALVPRGNWIARNWYDFPALSDGGLDRLADHALAVFREGMAVDRLILTAHSGGGMPAVDAIAGAARRPDELHVFDGFYGRNPAEGDPFDGIEILDRWLAERLAQEPGRAGALRVLYIEAETGPFSRKVGELIGRRLAAAPPTRLPALRRRYRVERAPVQHARGARRCSGELLARADCEFDWSR
ncbi:MAG TPA: hypothetical protein VGR91_14235 [Stellaceae bacterium]|nr:hypothetical protein [Stellaceae bacterium]